MVQTIKQKINNWRYVIAGVVAIIIFLSVRSCVEKQRAVANAMVKVAQEKVDKALDGTAVAEREKARLRDSIRLEDIKKRAKLKELQDKQIASEEKVKTLEKETQKAKDQVKNMNLVQVAQSLNQIYGGNNATATSNSVDAKGNLPYQLVETALDNSSAKDIIKEKDLQLKGKDSTIVIKNQQLKDASLSIFSAEKTADTYKELSGLQTELNKNLEKENKKLRTKSLIDKIIIPVAAVAGFLIGSK